MSACTYVQEQSAAASVDLGRLSSLSAPLSVPFLFCVRVGLFAKPHTRSVAAAVRSGRLTLVNASISPSDPIGQGLFSGALMW